MTRRSSLAATCLTTIWTASLVGLTRPEAQQLLGEEPRKPPAYEFVPYSEGEREHWSFLPVQDSPVPTFEQESDRTSVESPVDAFILQRLRVDGLRHGGA